VRNTSNAFSNTLKHYYRQTFDEKLQNCMCAVWNLVEEFVQIHYIFFFIDEYADSWILFKSNKSE